jgi:predicted nucleic acid-binding protein
LSSYVIDAWAWVEYLVGSELGAKLNEIIDENENKIYTCAITLAEVISKVAREKRDIEKAYKILTSNSQIINIDKELSLQAGLLHCEMKRTLKDFGLADAYVLATARKLNAKVLTGDKHFQNIKDSVMLK